MKISNLDTKSPQDDGAFMHLEHTKFGHVMYSGEGADEHGRWVSDREPGDEQRVGLVVRGFEARSVQAFTREQQRKNLANSKKSKPTPLADLEFENGIKLACVLIVDFVNIEDENGDPLEPTDENKRQFITISDDVSRQVVKFARERDNFFEVLSSD